MNEDDFNSLSKQTYNLIPVVRTILADFDTPLSVYLKLADKPYSYLLESAAQGGERWSRYSIIGLPSRTVLKVSGEVLTVSVDGCVTETIETQDPLTEIERFKRRYSVPEIPDLPRFFGGLVGYFGYDTVRYVEPKLKDSVPPDQIGTPDILLMLSNEIIVFDNVSNRIQLITLVDPQRENAWQNAQQRLDEILKFIRNPVPVIEETSNRGSLQGSDFESEFGEENFKEAVEVIREYIRAGDVMQVVLAQRLSVPFNLPPIQLYRALRSVNPSPYMYFMNLDQFHIVSSSPEILARVENGTVVNRPLAGTRRRGRTSSEDEALEQELLADPKEIAEHLMLIDLGRNDVGRVCKTGSVRVTDQFTVERYAHVMHIASNVEGLLADGKTSFDVLRATLPVGTLSGAPKIRAMEIIDELEPVKRGIYGGAVGYLAWNGNMDTAIAIRTAVIIKDRLYIAAGGGIVADSIPRLEWKESMNKGRSIFQAVAMVTKGLDNIV